MKILRSFPEAIVNVFVKFDEINKPNNSKHYKLKTIHYKSNLTQIKEVIKGASGGTYFRDVYSGYRKTWKEFGKLKDIDQQYYSSDYYDVELSKY